MAVQKPVQASLKLLVPLSTVMVTAAILAFTGVPDLAGPDPPVFTTTRHPDTGEHEVNWQIRTTPLLIYQTLHAAPAIVWCVGMPLQHSDRLRRYWPAFHRANGYFVLSGSLLLSITGYLMLFKNMSYSHENLFHIHNLNGVFPIGWPTFGLSLIILGPPYLFSLLQTVRTARAKNFVAHRQWAVFHTISAYAISLERVSLVTTYIVGWVLALFPKEKVHNFFRIENTLAGKAAAEFDIFALCNMLALVLLLAWGTYEYRKTGGAEQHEEMIAIIYIIWGSYLIRAARNPFENELFLDFSVTANVAHISLMTFMAIYNGQDRIHLTGDILAA
ncbi:hypothetical protein PVAR5_8274 [Paecilomyces variotii No. 5]|uniref:Uncharacterized protein n=1 Tax=Byssochlamys spectabilis (strain No. 5 / NBRC 109023) TaxID=1356009 RepID=V5FNG5_BYSSN|nr:hypothetical protein PVAR5_8274 [Paecilomyces variotii No. 5]